MEYITLALLLAATFLLWNSAMQRICWSVHFLWQFHYKFILNSFELRVENRTQIVWKNEAKVRKKAWFISSCIVKLEMARNIHFQMSKLGEKYCQRVSKLQTIFHIQKKITFANRFFWHFKFCHNRRNGFLCNSFFAPMTLAFIQ